MANAKEEYNKCALGYEKATIRPMRKFAYEPTILNVVRNMDGENVLDIACGEGVSSRMMKQLGARGVIGVDVSESLIKKAKEIGGEGTKYFLGDVFSEDLSKFGEFDAITGIMIIHYANSKEILLKLLKNIFNALRSGGVFYTLTINPEVLEMGYRNYGIQIGKAIEEGDSVKTELHDFEWNKFCDFTNYYWSKKTYENVFREAGFQIEWIPGIVSESGLKEYGEGFWGDYLKNPPYMMIKAKKIE